MTVSLPMSARPFHPREQGDQTRALIWSPLLRATHAAQANVIASVKLGFSEVLLVEDDPLVADAMDQLLQAWGLHVRKVATAAQALRQSGFGQLAICDVRLPDGAVGLEVALQMRKMGKKVLLISGETHLALRESAQHHQLLLLTKPVSSTELLAALQSL